MQEVGELEIAVGKMSHNWCASGVFLCLLIAGSLHVHVQLAVV